MTPCKRIYRFMDKYFTQLITANLHFAHFLL
ncbi:hypothetical protein BH11VER1_BH11VER1_41700 [soil metagenome]